MKKVLITVLLTIVLVLTLVIAGAVGYIWYRDNHIFVEGTAYSIKAESLDLREEDISIAHYDAVHSRLPECDILWMVPFQGGKQSSDITSLTLEKLSREDMERLSYFPKLKTIVAAFEDYAILEELMAVRPDLEVAYQVSIGPQKLDPGTETLTLEPGEFDYDTLMENLLHLPGMKTITFRMSELTQDQVAALSAAYPDIAISCTVEILGQEYDTETTALDLCAMASDQVEEVAQKLSLLPNLETVDLSGCGASQLTKADVKVLQAAATGVLFDYTFEFFGQTLSAADEEVVFKNVKMGDEAEEELRLTLDLLPNCKRFVLDNCHFSDEVLAKVREDYRHQTKVVWRIWFGKGTTLTDAEIIRAVYDLSDKNCKDLIYCEDARFVDFGHNGDDGNYLHDCSYVAGMPKLEAIILSSAYISDLSAFANCKELKMLEIAFCGMVTDISPLANCEKLEMLNISFTGVTDLSPLDKLPITHLCAMNYSGKRASQEEQDRFQQLHPDCWSQYVGEQPYGPGWRYTEDGKDYLPYYQLLRDVFQYDIYPKTPNHVGWYLSEELIEKHGL